MNWTLSLWRDQRVNAHKFGRINIFKFMNFCIYLKGLLNFSLTDEIKINYEVTIMWLKFSTKKRQVLKRKRKKKSNKFKYLLHE